MLDNKTCVACVLVLSSVASVSARAQPDEVFELGEDKFLFLDDFLLERTEHAEPRVNPPRTTDSALIADKPWEVGGITSYGNVLRDPLTGEYRMYYVPVCWDVAPGFCLALATSQDGVHWRKPNLDAVDWKGSKANNIVVWAQREGTVIIDPNAPAERRYALISSHPDLKTRLFTSADGIHWTMDPAMISKHHSDSQISSFWDEQLKKYVHYPRVGHRGRAIGRVETSRMDEVWPERIPVVLSADDRDPAEMDLYTNAAQKYALAKNAYLAFPTPYYHYNRPEERAYLVEPTLATGGKTNDGTIETQLATSRDGRRWTRYRTPYVPLQIFEGLDIKIAMIIPGIIQEKGKLYQYFAGYTFTHGDTQVRHGRGGRRLGGIFRLEQRVDGFVSLDFDYEGGEVVTAPFRFKGRRLTLNVNTSASGEGRVALLDADGREMNGYRLADARYINGNYLEKTVAWRDGHDVSALAGKPIRLRFVFRGTKLYSFQFKE